MRKLDIYIYKNVIGAIVVVLLGLAVLESMFSFLAQMNNMRAHYGLLDVLVYTILLLPKKIYAFIPTSAVIGCLVGLGNLASSSELTVMRAAGVSLWRLVCSALIPALILAIIGAILGEYIAPAAEQVAETHRSIARSAEGNYSGEGFWHHEGNDFMYFNAVEPNGVLYGMSLYKFDDDFQLKSSVLAKRAIYLGDHWMLEGVKRSDFNGKEFVTIEKAVEPWMTSLTTTLLKVVVVKPEGLSMTGLWAYSNYLEDQGLDSGEYWLAFWNKVLQPLSIFALVLVGVSFVLGPLRSVSIGFRVFLGVITGIVFFIIQSILGPSSLVFGFSPILAVLMPILVFFGLGLFFLRRVG